MELEFDRGKPSHPSGHALVYFRDAHDSQEIGVTYVVILPVPLDLSKYMPPFLASQVADVTSETISSFAFPPAPEPFAGMEELMLLAALRDDDVIYAGTHSLSDAFGMMEKVSEATSIYSDIYYEAYSEEGVEKVMAEMEDYQPHVEDDDGEDDYDDMALDDLVYGSMGEADLLTELTSLLGRMRYAVDGGDEPTANETRLKIRAIGRYLPANRRVADLIEVASRTSAESSKLAQLYLERAYCLYREDYMRLKKIEEDIAELSPPD